MAGEWVLVTEGGDGQSRASPSPPSAPSARTGTARPSPSTTASPSPARRATPRAAYRYPSARSTPRVTRRRSAPVRDASVHSAVFPGSDAALVALDAPVQHLINKESSARLAVAAGLPVPLSSRVDNAAELLDAAHELEYPIVVKPVVKRYAAARSTRRKSSKRSRPARRDDRPARLPPREPAAGWSV